ncbi:cation:proton antiporter [Psychrobium sp. 1_MG-2023]|uniref:cation:proton antiporter n=1 Tax=Psychrobium sp. 1_MG-2023 TaxID=3062624 RepID=UPI0026A13924|nr:cation:proton antiporter [Psychrobium sp. 1_MG-2023]MDP2561138.1 cation:proton antiporter [Psychrobium sp. 1_MG-2023]
MEFVIATAGPSTEVLLILGALFLVGLFANELGKKTHIPRVTLLLVVGAAASPYGLNIVPQEIQGWFPYISQIALCMVGFLLGEQFVYRTLLRSGRVIWLITIFESLGTSLLVFIVLYLIGVPSVIAILLAGIAPATAPAATLDVIKESKLKGLLPNTLLRVVAIDDAFGIIIFALCLALAGIVHGSADLLNDLSLAAWEVLSSILIGCIIGWPMAKLTGRLSPGEPTLIEALGFVLLGGGLAQLIGGSYLLSSIVLGAVVANVATHHKRPFHAIEGISSPLLIIFFLMAGFQFNVEEFSSIGFVGGAYIVARSVGLIVGGYCGARLASAPKVVQNHIGWCLLPQAGIALGLALMAADRYPEYATSIISLLVSTTIAFELFGPLVTKLTLLRADRLQRTEKSKNK